MKIRRVLTVFALFALGGCGGLHLQQADNKVLIRHGAFGEELPAADYARHFLPYAVFALKAYDTKRVAGDAGIKDPIPSKRWKSLTDKEKREAEQWVAGWSKIDSFDSGVDSALPCGRSPVLCTNLKGLGFDVWVKGVCKEVVVAFRGTNFSEWEDWITNFRWVTRVLPLFDQYEQVQDNIDRILAKARQQCPGKNLPIVATGHSLGGGLAQQAAYMSKAIRRVVVFDPSIVTGYMDRHVPTQETRFNLQIERVYEHGEILAYPRLFVRSVVPNSVRDPLIRTTRFSHIHNQSIVSQHSMAKLMVTIMEFSRPRVGKAAKPMPCDLAAYQGASLEPYNPKDCVPFSPPAKAGSEKAY